MISRAMDMQWMAPMPTTSLGSCLFGMVLHTGQMAAHTVLCYGWIPHMALFIQTSFYDCPPHLTVTLVPFITEGHTHTSS